MVWQEDSAYFKYAIELSEAAGKSGNDPFAAILVGPDGEILLEQKNAVKDLGNDQTAHDSLLLASRASKKFDPEFLKQCTLYATMEPCFMCLGGIFWANIGKVKFIVSEAELNRMFGGDPGIDIHSREIAERLGKKIEISGPFDELALLAKPVIEGWIKQILSGNKQ